MNTEKSTASIDDEAVLDAIGRAESLTEQIEDYREKATEIDAAFSRSNGHRPLSLDEMPYGEELIRTAELPAELDQALQDLRKIVDGKLQGEEAKATLESALETIENAQSTIEDCTPIDEADTDDE